MKLKIALFFSVLFLSMLAAPTIITLVDNSEDISIFLDLAEEEEENHLKETFKELKIYTNIHLDIFFRRLQKRKNVIFYSKNYASQYLKITTPPPKLYTII